MKINSTQALLTILAAASLAACSSSKSSAPAAAATTDSTVAGTLTSTSVSSKVTQDGQFQTMATKQITHIMAVAPASTNPMRYVSEVDTDGSFSLALKSGSPYMIVFISQDGVLTGPNMIVGTVNISSNGLDTLPVADAGTVDLGDVTVDGSDTTKNTTISTSVADLLTALGVTSGEADFIGDIDDLALRLANPDVDSNGVIDALEDKNFGMDWHVRADTKTNSAALAIGDIENQFADAGGATITLEWTLSSGYATYPRSFDDTDYIPSGTPGLVLETGGDFDYTGSGIAHTSYSGGIFSDMRQWGPDYDMTSQEMGASDAAATFVYTMDAKTLTYSHVRTKTKSQLGADGVLLPFVKINTTSGKITGISYKWMKRQSSAWVDATLNEVQLLAQSGGMLNLYTNKDADAGLFEGLGFQIPSTSISGTITIGGSGYVDMGGVSDTSNVALSDICNAALSYDDKMGLRIFAGAPTTFLVTTCD